MSTNPVRPTRNINTRRSQRLMLKMAVAIAGPKASGGNFVEQTITEVVNAHGALIHLKEPVSDGQQLRIRNAKTGEEQSCKVIGVGQSVEGKAEVGIEFLEPAPRFWRIAFPPEDWNINSPEAKRSGKTSAGMQQQQPAIAPTKKEKE
jgi:hypothetical protein